MSSSSLPNEYHHHHRIVLLFDLDCFYAQAERVRLGLDVGVCLALLQWNSVLAVTYPAREFGIKRGDSWEAVDSKSKGECWAIHLQVLLRKQQQQQQQQDDSLEETNNDDDNDDSIQQAFEKNYNLPQEEKEKCQKNERGVRRFYHEGKACLERYRIASMRIFNVVLSSLEKRLGRKDFFVLERASIDEFYLDITKYCYDMDDNDNDNDEKIMTHKTVVVGENNNKNDFHSKQDAIHNALQRACQVSHFIREDVWNTLGFTMSAGISTNKMMAKLAASYGKPSGQAVLHPDSFEYLMDQTKIRKVRHFGGKLGQQVLKTVLSSSSSSDCDNATMGNLRQVPLPTLERHFSRETAQFIFDACRGIDHEVVKETTGALVKSITAFKSFPATASCTEIRNWLELLAREVTSRVAKDTARNHRYPKSCTLNFSYYTTPTGQRPNGTGSTRSQRQTRSLRLLYPKQSHNNKAQELVQQGMEKLTSILQQHPIRGIGLSANNFEARGQPPEGVASINNFFSKQITESSSSSQISKSPSSYQTQSLKRPPAASIDSFYSPSKQLAPIDSGPIHQPAQASLSVGNEATDHRNLADKDLELAKKLQASYDRENYILSKTAKRGPAKKKVRRIDTFFCKR